MCMVLTMSKRPEGKVSFFCESILQLWHKVSVAQEFMIEKVNNCIMGKAIAVSTYMIQFT